MAVHLKTVWQGAGENESVWMVAKGGVASIVLRTDGNGPMGHYDRIHITMDDGRSWCLPAHMCGGWEYPRTVKP